MLIHLKKKPTAGMGRNICHLLRQEGWQVQLELEGRYLHGARRYFHIIQY